MHHVAELSDFFGLYGKLHNVLNLDRQRYISQRDVKVPMLNCIASR